MPDFYETAAQVNEYLVFHYASIDQTLRWEFGPHQAFGFHARLAECIDSSQLPEISRALDLGCSVGRTSFELAKRSDGLVLGVDLHLPMLRLARRVLETGTVSYARRRVGIVYDRRDFDVAFDDADRVDFWACDAMALPFRDAGFGHAMALNVLDCVNTG